ncbi:MAG TPA: hypothetical protein VMT12_10960 [Syntrophales bacterium]|nr:hypothetical protein [Syntrophales bacterium]
MLLSARAMVSVIFMARCAIIKSVSPSNRHLPKCGDLPIKTISCTVKGKIITESWETTAMIFARVSLLSLLHGVPSIHISPSCGVRTPSIILSMVVFPEPLGPMMPTNSPLCTSKETFLRTQCLLYLNPTCLSLIMDMDQAALLRKR